MSHLKGGIHRYLESYPDGYFKGKNFVFDSRQTVGGEGGVGRCIYCNAGWDMFKPGNVCTVCREQLLVCDKCECQRGEYHCFDHKDLGEIYFTDLSVFEEAELRGQREGLVNYLKEISVGKKWKSRRRTVMKQMEKIDSFLEGLGGGRRKRPQAPPVEVAESSRARGIAGATLGEIDAGRCWRRKGRKWEGTKLG